MGGTYGSGSGANTITLEDTTIRAIEAGIVFNWIATTATTGDATLLNTDVTTTLDHSPVFQQIGGWVSITVTGGSLSTAGADSPIIRLASQNNNTASTRSTVILKNTVLTSGSATAIDLNMDADDPGGILTPVSTIDGDYFDIIVQSSTVSGKVAATRIATGGSHEVPRSGNTKFFIFDSTFSGGIMMVSGSGYRETSGNLLTLTASNAVFDGGMIITGTEAAQRSNQAILYVYDSSWTGDIELTNRGNLVLQFSNTPIDGGFILSGSTNTYIDLINSSVTGGISIDGTATLQNRYGLDINNRRAAVHNSVITGGFSLAGASTIDLPFSGNTVVSGGITTTGSSTGVFRLEQGSSINGGITLSGTSSVSIVLYSGGQLTGDLVVNERATLSLSTFANNIPIYLNGGFTLGGTWRISEKTALEGGLTLSGSLGTISIANAGTDSLVLTNGMTGKGRLDIESIDYSNIGKTEIRIIHDKTGTLPPDAFVLAQPIDYGLVAYDIANRPDGVFLVNVARKAVAQLLKDQLEAPGVATITVDDNVPLSLVGGATVASGKTIVGASHNSGIIGSLTIPENANGIVILGINFTDGTLAINGAVDVEITHCTFTDTPVIITDGADNITFSWNKFTAMTGGGSAMTISNAGAGTGILLHNNLWSDGLKTDMPSATNARAYMFNNYFTPTDNSSATSAGADAQILSINNIYQNTINPLAKQSTGLLRASGNFTTATSGSNPSATGDDTVFVPAYSHVMQPAGIGTPLSATVLANLITAYAGNTAGKYSHTPVMTNGTASISASVSGNASSKTNTSAHVPTSGGFTLTANASGFTPSTRQWYRDNFAITGATAATHTVTNASAATHAGAYTVAMTTSDGEIVTSGAFTVTVGALAAPVITTHPVSKTINVGGSATLSAVATGNNLTYQWRKGGVNISGATGSSHTISNAQQSHAGSYAVIVANASGTVTSNAATLIVNTSGNDNSGGGGGGGAPSLLYLGVFAILGALRLRAQRG
ncbi:immunoglobulin domain-containing protein [Ereboglobus luteus]|uniref:Ig-like domain-containing protein n=1 Tax=Ereboglobus luteus TaxID=1796921 RepID=A0A2U8E4N7_9BACT|nr:immunoglobulin domain-containing protein [Ereboglobus luteus]AWI09780.1 hypothetical protein CKA38_11435 [Ereboglobus luteus]